MVAKKRWMISLMVLAILFSLLLPVLAEEENTYVVTYLDGADGSLFWEDFHEGIPAGNPTPLCRYADENNELTRGGYSFEGWTVDGISPGWSSTVTESVTYTALWAEKPLEIQALSVEDFSLYLDERTSDYFDPKVITVSTNYGDFTNEPASLIWDLMAASGNYELQFEYGVTNSESLAWEEGVHTVTYQYGGVTTSYQVTVKGSLFAGLSISNRQLPLDGFAGCTEIRADEYSPLQIQITLSDSDHTILTGSPYEVAQMVYDQYGFYPNCGCDSPSTVPAQAGDYQISWHFGSQSNTYTLTLSDSLIESLTVDDIIGWAEYLPMEKVLSAFWEPQQITVTLKDGSSYSGTPQNVSLAISSAAGFQYSYSVETTFPYNEYWERDRYLGDYENTLSFGGATANYTLHVQMLIAELQKSELRYEYSDDYGPAAFFPPTPTYMGYLVCSPWVSVTLFDGTVYSGFPEVVQQTIKDNYLNEGTAVQTLPLWGDYFVWEDDRWEPGTYEYSFEFMRHSVDFTIYVLSPGSLDPATEMNYLTGTGLGDQTPCDVDTDRRTNATDLLALLQQEAGQ